MKVTNRRKFVSYSMAAPLVTGALSSFGARRWANVLGANDDIRVAVVGIGGQGRHHISSYLETPGARVVALCDVDSEHLDRGLQVANEGGARPKSYRDFRRLLEDNDIDAISVATPNHWHSLQAIWACQAGKDVTVEKPVSHNIFEGRKLVEAARKYDRLVQGDFDIRSKEGVREAIDFIRAGGLGKIVAARGFIYKRRTSIGRVNGPQQVPESIDYDLWTGPAPLKPLMRKRLHYVWHWVWDTGCGELGNNGPHHLDLCRWALGEKGLPRRVMSVGGRFGYDDDGETPNTQFVYLDYESAPIIYEFRGLGDVPTSPDDDTYESPMTARMEQFEGRSWKSTPLKTSYKGTGVNSAVFIECTYGYVELNSLVAYDYDGKEIRRWPKSSDSPRGSFIKAVRSRRLSDLRNEILDGHLSTALSHMGNISLRLGIRSSPEEVRESISGNQGLAEVFARFQEHLVKHGIDLNRFPMVLGPMLEFDSKTEMFVGPWSREANMLLSRNYRTPFVVPEDV